MINFIYPSKSVGVIRVEAALTIDSTLTARGFFQSKEISLGIDCISDVRQIETLLTELVSTISRSSKKISQPRDMIAEATALLQNAISCIEDHSKEDIDDKSNDAPFLPSLQFILCQLRNLCIQKNRRRYNTIIKSLRLKLTSYLQLVTTSYSHLNVLLYPISIQSKTVFFIRAG